jgi:hypothetical protein
MATQQLTLRNRTFPRIPPSETTAEIVAVLETQLDAFRSIYDITARLRERFLESDASAALSQGVRERAVHLERAREYEKRLQELKLQWEARCSVPATEYDARIAELLRNCQEVIGRIVETDRALNQAATGRQAAIQSELAQIHQRRHPLAAYFATPALPATYSVPVTGANVHFQKA